MKLVEIKDNIIDVDTITSISNVVYDDSVSGEYFYGFVSHYFNVMSLGKQIVIRNVVPRYSPNSEEIQQNKEYVESLRTQLLDIWGGNAPQIIKIA